MGEISIDPKFNIHETYKKMRILNPYRNGGSAENPLYNNIKECYALRRIKASGVNSVRIERTSDNLETDVILPVNYTDFISLDSEVSAGGTLGNWIGSSSAILKKFYGQKGYKDLLTTTGTLFYLIISGALQKINGNAAFTAIDAGGAGFRAPLFNGGASIQNASLFGVYESFYIYQANRAFGFGNYDYDSSSSRVHWNVASDNSLRFDGGALTGNSIPPEVGVKVRTTIKNGDYYSDFINNSQNIAPTALLGTDIIDSLYIAPRISRNLNFSELIVFLTDESANRSAIETEINSVHNIY